MPVTLFENPAWKGGCVVALPVISESSYALPELLSSMTSKECAHCRTPCPQMSRSCSKENLCDVNVSISAFQNCPRVKNSARQRALIMSPVRSEPLAPKERQPISAKQRNVKKIEPQVVEASELIKLPLDNMIQYNKAFHYREITTCRLAVTPTV